MANASVFDTGYEQGSRIAQDQFAHKQALSNEEHEQKVDTLIDEMHQNQAKLSTLKDENGNPLPGYDETLGNLQNNFRDLRLLYDPKEHPGAIQRIGWKLTDALHLTKAADRQKKNEAREAVSPQDKFSAHSWAGAAPISPGQTAMAGAKSSEAVALEMIKGKMKMLHTLFPDASPEQMTQWQNELAAGVTGVKNPADKYFKDLVTTTDEDGKQHYWRVPLADEAPEEVDFDGQKMQPKNPPHPSHSKFSETEAAYRHDYNIPTDEPLSMADIMFINQQTALSSGTPSSTTTNTLKQDVNGWWVPVTETNRRVPGFGTILPPPRGSLPGQEGQQPPSEHGGNAKPKNQSAGPATPHSHDPQGGVSSGSTHVGTPLFQGRTPAISKAQDDVVAAQKLDSLADQAVASHEALQQRQLALALIKAMASRVNMQEYQQYTTKMGVENTIEGMIKGIESGQLPEGIVRQLADAAHANLKAAQEALKFAMQSPDNATPKHKIKIGDKYYVYNGTGDTADLKNYTETTK